MKDASMLLQCDWYGMTAGVMFHPGGRVEGVEVLMVRRYGPGHWTLYLDNGEEFYCTPLVAAAVRQDNAARADRIHKLQYPGRRGWVAFSSKR